MKTYDLPQRRRHSQEMPLLPTTISELPKGIGKWLTVRCSNRDSQYSIVLSQLGGMPAGTGSDGTVCSRRRMLSLAGNSQ